MIVNLKRSPSPHVSRDYSIQAFHFHKVILQLFGCSITGLEEKKKQYMTFVAIFNQYHRYPNLKFDFISEL